MDRRQFGTLLAAGALGATTHGLEPARAADTPHGTTETAQQPGTLQLMPNGWMPNNPTLPVLIYRGAFLHAGGNEPLAAAMEASFERNGWPAQWRNGVYDFHHFHSTAHELLGIAGGRADLVLGGEGGNRVEVAAGDVLLLPVGTGHCRLSASEDFLVVGAYPRGETWDVCRAAPDAAMLQRMKHVRFPASDPVHGAGGPLLRLWKQS